MIRLYQYQLDALDKMHNGCILCGGVGSGKSITSLAYYYLKQGGDIDSLTGGNYVPMDDPPKDLYIITTARKRDTFEWSGELSPFLLSPHADANLYQNKVVVDSWNNIGKYVNVRGAFFIFDEQRVVGRGAWVKAFLTITKSNSWIMLSATPGDTWQDYVPVFIANSFYKNRTEFNSEHVIFNRFTPYPSVDRYINTGRLIRLRNRILVDMEGFKRPAVSHHKDVWVSYNSIIYKDLIKTRYDIFKDRPMETANDLCLALRKVVNSDESRITALLEIFEKHPRVIVFYNFDYELEELKAAYYGEDVIVAEWNGHKHQEIPESEKWVYLVQYNAGAEGWNCIKTDTIVFFSQNYSYKVMVQSSGRIDRCNTPYKDLYYYHLKSHAGIDVAISRALREKKDFNEMKFVGSKRG